jgi:SOS-response transcriptional repressor LexA
MSSKFSEYRLFSKGDMVLVYPSESPKDGDYVLARHRDKDIVAVRYYLAQGGIVLLRVGNSIFESLNGNLDTYEILGVVKQQIVRFE